MKRIKLFEQFINEAKKLKQGDKVTFVLRNRAGDLDSDLEDITNNDKLKSVAQLDGKTAKVTSAYGNYVSVRFDNGTELYDIGKDFFEKK